MQRQSTSQSILTRAVKLLLSVTLIVGLAPSIALASTTVGVQVVAPTHINETVALEQGSEDAQTPVATQPEATDTTPEVAPASASASNDNSTQITSEVAVGTPDATSNTLLVDGLTYQLNHTTNEATLTGYYGNTPEGDIIIPSTVTDGKTTYTLKIAGGGRF